MTQTVKKDAEDKPIDCSKDEECIPHIIVMPIVYNKIIIERSNEMTHDDIMVNNDCNKDNVSENVDCPKDKDCIKIVIQPIIKNEITIEGLNFNIAR